MVGAGSRTDLHSCFTHPDFQKRGAGGMMMQWGCDLADQLFLPAWVEASPAGRFLYTKYGWEDYTYLKGELPSAVMMRKAKSSA